MLSYIFPKSSRLLRARDFRLCVKYGQESCGRYLCVQIRKTHYPETKLGLTVSRRYGKAVRRNRFKRCVREAFRLSQHKIPSNLHINVRPKRTAHQASFQEICDEFIVLIDIVD